MIYMRLLRECLGYTQREVAAHLGVPLVTYHRYEKLSQVPNPGLSRRFIQLYGRGWPLPKLLREVPPDLKTLPVHHLRCVVCGKEFTASQENQRVCGNPACHKTDKVIYMAAYRKAWFTK